MKRRRGLKGTSPQHAERAKAHFAAAGEELEWAASPATREYGGRPKILAKAARHITAGFANCEWVTASRAAQACDAEGRRLTRKLAELEGPERALTHNLAIDDGFRGAGRKRSMSKKVTYKAGAVSATDAVRQLKAAAAKCDVKWMKAHAASARFFGARESEVKAAAKRCPSAKAGLIGVKGLKGSPRQHLRVGREHLSAVREQIQFGGKRAAGEFLAIAQQECSWARKDSKTRKSAELCLKAARGLEAELGRKYVLAGVRKRKAQKARR